MSDCSFVDDAVFCFVKYFLQHFHQTVVW